MQNYVISTLKDLDLMSMGKGNRYFALANFYLTDEKYKNYFLQLRKQPGVFITLDCGSAEGETVTMQQYLDITQELQPDEVLALDVLCDTEATLKSFKTFTDGMKEREINVNVFACPQGSNKKEYLECYEEFLNNDLVKTIGLSKIAVPKAFLNETGDRGIKEGRQMCVKHLFKNDLVKKPIS